MAVRGTGDHCYGNACEALLLERRDWSLNLLPRTGQHERGPHLHRRRAATARLWILRRRTHVLHDRLEQIAAPPGRVRWDLHLGAVQRQLGVAQRVRRTLALVEQVL